MVIRCGLGDGEDGSQKKKSNKDGVKSCALHSASLFVKGWKENGMGNRGWIAYGLVMVGTIGDYALNDDTYSAVNHERQMIDGCFGVEQNR